MGINWAYIAKTAGCVLALCIYCEFIIYYVVLIQCSWPHLDPNRIDKTIIVKVKEPPVKALILADTHLLGSRNGHWFDKLRREWQMYRAFQTAMTLHQPDVVFILGDLFDEGLWCSQAEFAYYVNRFNDLFRVPSGTQMFVVVGNHDIGFHYGISPYLNDRFASAFKSPGVRMLTIRGSHFVLMNSMALEGDGCFLCRPAQLHMNKIARQLKCARGVGKCDKNLQLAQFSRPIVLQHFPMYRESDSECVETDHNSDEIKAQKFRERWECLSRESSEMVYDELNPRLVVDGHVHHGCHKVHRQDIHEYTLPSFSWRNKDNPSFLLAVFTPDNYAVSKCAMPQESTVILVYIVGGALITLWVALTHRRICHGRTRWFKKH